MANNISAKPFLSQSHIFSQFPQLTMRPYVLTQVDPFEDEFPDPHDTLSFSSIESENEESPTASLSAFIFRHYPSTKDLSLDIDYEGENFLKFMSLYRIPLTEDDCDLTIQNIVIENEPAIKFWHVIQITHLITQEQKSAVNAMIKAWELARGIAE